MDMDRMGSQLAAIRAQLAARNELAQLHLPPIASAPKPSEPPRPAGRSKLPLIQRIQNARAARASPKDPFLQVENVLQRAIEKDIYDQDVERVKTTEKEAARAMQEAQQLGDEARLKMVAYSQNESGWRFEERSTRYQQVLDVKQSADTAQHNAEMKRDEVRQRRALLRDPYKELKTVRTKEDFRDPSYAKRKQFAWLWVLAAPSTKLGFTPREEMPEDVMNSEKELSMFVVYYIAGSSVNDTYTEAQWQKALENDCPPTTGWICCSVHGVPPAPELTGVRSGMQTWTVSGAGAGHLNGKYVAFGVHDEVRKFKSSAGVELFRKCLPVTSSIVKTLYDGETSRPVSAASSITDEELQGKEHAADETLTQNSEPSIQLPSGLASIGKNEHDFRSMQRVGSWLSMNEATEKHRRLLLSRFSREKIENGDDSAKPVARDGDNVMNQNPREVESNDFTSSRPGVSAPLCREWILFARCSRRTIENSTTSAARSPKKGIGLGCLKRHYYISQEEKKAMTTWVQTKESWLEKNVLAVIIEREAQMDRIHHLCRKCMVRFQQNLQKDTEKTKAKLFAELNRVRFLTVKVFEAIDRWRQHARQVGFARYDADPPKKKLLNDTGQNKNEDTEQAEAPLLGWSSSITLETGRQLYKGSKAFVSKVKRFRRAEDILGKKEQHITYLGYFETQEEAERAYDEHAASEARRLNTTVEHLPSRRSVFRSCGKHFAVESEKGGPSFCIECKTKQLASLSSSATDEWIPPFVYGINENYIMKMASDLDFLDDVVPLKAALNDGRGCEDEVFPMRGNVFLLPKTPIQDPDLAVFTTFPSSTAPRLGELIDPVGYSDVDDEALDRDRILRAQQILLQELQIYRPELIDRPVSSETTLKKKASSNALVLDSSAPQYRLVEALYWDHCAALKMLQQRPPLALRQPNIWCRPDEGEWASLVIRGSHQLHYLFEEKLEKAGKEMVQRRQQVLMLLRQLNKIPLYFVSSRIKFTELITAGQEVRGDVVQLEVNITMKRLQRYDTWCVMSLVVQRWFRGVLGRRKARAVRKALQLSYKLRIFYYQQVATLATSFYEKDVLSVAVGRAAKIISRPVFSRAVTMNGEPLTVSFHSLRHYQIFHEDAPIHPHSQKYVQNSSCCQSCARRFQIKVQYQCAKDQFGVVSGVCSCRFNGGVPENDSSITESWLLRAYSPYHNTVYRMRLDVPQLLQLLSSQFKSMSASPIEDMEEKTLGAITAARHAIYIFEQAARAGEQLSNWRRMNSEATQTRKSLTVALEKKLSLLGVIKRSHSTSIVNAVKALDFASRPFSEAQAWDPLENANDWRHIVEKRRLGKQSAKVQLEVERLRVAFFQATYNDQFARAGATQAQHNYINYWLPLIEQENRLIEAAGVLETKSKARMEDYMQQLCDHFLNVRDGNLPTRRHLTIQSPTWRNMVPIYVDIPAQRRRLNYLRTRTLTLSNRSREGIKTRKMIVSVSMWPLLSRGGKYAHRKRDMWITAYDPKDCSFHEVFLEWELVELLTGPQGRKISRGSNATRSRWQATAEVLLSRVMLDRFTGEFTLEKLQFYHTLRRLKPQFLFSRVMRDLQAGRKSGQGDEILRRGVCVDGRLCMVTVYENWGDLTFALYHTNSGRFYRLLVPLCTIFNLLSRKPLMLRLWICCVKSNCYSSTLLAYILKFVRFVKNDGGLEDIRLDEHLLALTSIKRHRAAIRIENRNLLISIAEDSGGDLRILGYDINSSLTYKLSLEREFLRRTLKSSTSGFILNSWVISPSSLLLKRNRNLLYKWICSRLRLQSFLEHQDDLMSGVSPLLAGLHLRESYQIFNRWVASSSRIPLSAVPESEIDEMAFGMDATASSNHQFDQLTLITHECLPLGFEKDNVGAINKLDAVSRLHELPPQPLDEGIDVTERSPAELENAAIAPKHAEQNLEEPTNESPQPVMKNPWTTRAENWEISETLTNDLVHRFKKNQSAVRAAACSRMLERTAAPSTVGTRCTSEWVNMMQEDWRSQDMRGMLVQDDKVLAKLANIYAVGTRQAREFRKASSPNDNSALRIQIKCIAKGMDQNELQPGGIELFHSIRSRRWRRYGKSATSGEEATLADVAEWWRQYSIKVPVREKKIPTPGVLKPSPS